MKSIRRLIDGFVWEHLEKFVSMVDEGGEDTVFEGIRVLDEPEKFVHGALINATANLYVHYVKVNDARSEITIKRLEKFLKFVIDADIKTWGKLSCLRGLYALYSANLLDKIDSSVIEILRKKTDYTDFYDKNNNEIISLPTNYYRVAMACAGYRERLGWDEEIVSEKIKNKLVGLISEGSEIGWMDEEPPYGRFDRYSLILSSEFADTVMKLGLDMPEFLKNNLKNAAEIALFMANGRGDGVNYGRSLSCHGDATPLEIIASALAMGLVDKKKYSLAIAYSVKIIEKIFNFWYNTQKGSFDIWWGGRSTNKYRQSHRVLEVNLDMAMHLITTLANFERASAADVIADDSAIDYCEEWRTMRVDFTSKADKSLFILKHKDFMCMLPLVGVGTVCDWAAYMPYPAICGILEGAPQAHMPFLVPEYTVDDKKARPLQFYNTFSSFTEEDKTVIVALGNLAYINDGIPVKSSYEFETTYTFEKDSLTVIFDTNAPYRSVRMITGVHSDEHKLSPLGFDSTSPVKDIDAYDLKTPSGAIIRAEENFSENQDIIGYRLIL